MIRLKKACSILLATLLSASSFTMIGIIPVHAASVSLPSPVISYDFEDPSATASLRHNANIVKDLTKDSNVLQLTGGSNGTSYMNLPANWNNGAGSSGVTISTWVKADSATGDYTKLFECSNTQLGTTKAGKNSAYADPEFDLAAGGSVYDLALLSAVSGSTATSATESKVCYSTHLTRGVWQYLTVVLTTSGLSVYINGKQISYQDAQQSTSSIASVLSSFLTKTDGSGIASYVYAAIGRSYYTNDNDFQGAVDDFSVYNTALTSDQVAALFNTFPAIDTSPVLSVDMTNSTGAIRHGASGFLYGLGANNVPDTNVLAPIKPNICAQKPPEGLQHPGGDAIQVADTFLQSGGKYVQVYCPDIYASWPYENNPSTSDANWADYAAKLAAMVQQGKDAGLNGSLVYVVYNEPDGNWFSGLKTNTTVMNTFDQYWLKAYNAVKSVDPDAKLAGPNLSSYSNAMMANFVSFCEANNCMPDQFTWHVLSDSLYGSFSSNMANYQNLEVQYGFTRDVVINEYGAMTDMGNPGKLVKYLGLFEDYKVDGCLAYWHTDNNLADLVADENQPNAAWWLYKWYGDMSGNTLKITQYNTSTTGLYGVASLDDNKKQTEVLFGGVSGTGEIALQNVTGAAAFQNTKKVKVKLEATNYVGINGATSAPALVREEIDALNSDGSLTVSVDNMDSSAAYNLIVTPADDGAATGIVQEGPWSQKIEAESGTFAGNASIATDTIYTYSGTGEVQNLNNDSDSVTVTATVPTDGWYDLDMIYGAATGNNTATPASNNPLTGELGFAVDGGTRNILSLPNTLNWFMCGKHTETVQLSAGTHTFTFSGVSASAGKATLDCVYVTYDGQSKPVFNETYEAEQSGFNVLGGQTATTVTTGSALPGYSGTGYVTGLNTSVESGGGIRFTTYADDNGLYNVTLRYSSNRAATMDLYLDNTAETLDNRIAVLSLSDTGGAWRTVTKTVYLQKGLNLIDVDTSDADVALDDLNLAQSSDAAGQTTTVEAEDCTLTGTADVQASSYASGGEYVSGILASTTASNTLSFTYNAPQAGKYKLAVYQSNSELFGAHSYNAQMVDRYITLSVNEASPSDYFFRNTYSDQSFRSQVITLRLQKGANTIKLWNDDGVVHKNGVGGVNVDVNYTPNLDKFEITPLAVDWAHSITVSPGIVNGTVVPNVTTATPGDVVTLTVTPDSGYQLSTLVVSYSGGNVTVSKNPDGTYSFTMPDDDVTVNASFAASGNGGGTATPSNNVFVAPGIANGTVVPNVTTATPGDVVTLTVTPDSGYQLSTLVVSYGGGNVSVSKNLDGTYSFTMPDGDVTVYASFKLTDSGGSKSGGNSGGSSISTAPVSVTGTSTSNADGTTTTTATIPAADTNSSSVSVVNVNLGSVSVSASPSILSAALGSDSTAALSMSQSASSGATQQSAFQLATTNGNAPIAALDLNLTKIAANGTTTAVHQLSGNVTVTITLTAAQLAAIGNTSNLGVYYYDTGTTPATLTDMHATYDAAKGTLTFTTDHFSTYVIAEQGAALTASVGVTYAAHVQRIGWQKFVSDGAEAGTEHRSLRLEGLQIKLTGDLPTGASIIYQAHVQKYGWMTPVADNALAGTTGKSLRMEALRISLKGLTGYAVKYRAYVQNKGWLNWVTTANGTDISKAAIAGTTGKSLRMEALEIQIVKIA